tara:strand:- start:3926 stop:4036 length:111 start_codon:yes stop_codon:yes gene_type:complete
MRIGEKNWIVIGQKRAKKIAISIQFLSGQQSWLETK